MGDRLVPSRLGHSLRLVRFVGALLLAGSAADVRGTVGPGPPAVALARPLGVPTVVRWQARTLVPGARFRLFRGAEGGPLGLIAEIEAKDGVRSYRVQDDAATGFNQVYELRVVSRDGREELLRRISCRRLDTRSPVEAATDVLARSLDARLQQVPTPLTPGSGRSGFAFGPADPFSALHPEPHPRPPRVVSAPFT